jgi:hypothetical protein
VKYIKYGLPALFLAVMVLAPSLCYADKYDLQLKRLWNPSTGKFFNEHQAKFEGLMSDMGAALAPRFLGPATTLGSLGFMVALDYSLTNINENASHWQQIMTDPSGGTSEGADSLLQVMQIHVRKGLPFSAEVGGTFTKLLQSKLWGVGLEFKIAPLEGFRNLPELAFRGSVSTFMGADDYSMLTANADVNLSKEIGIAALFKLSPYVGYNFQYIYANSNVVSVFDNAGTHKQFTLGAANLTGHYAVIGMQLVAVVVNTGFEATIGDGIQTYSFRLGVDF